MPLTFESLSHGTIAFGFFNIESDMLLCDRYFLFADDFCANIVAMVENAGDQSYRAAWDIQTIESAEDIGDLMGAIHGVRFTGFIGELYRRFPFPRQPEDFKQNPDGFRTQSIVSETIAKFAQPRKIAIAIDNKKMEIDIGSYRFNRIQFHELLKYVWRGGYPRWKNDIRPDYVVQMKKKITQASCGLFSDIEFGN
jgi:hypothetical protein